MRKTTALLMFGAAPTIALAAAWPAPARARPAPATAAAARAAFIRVDQAGYEAGRAARAFLMTRGSAAGERFAIRTVAGRVVARRRVGARLGTWSHSRARRYRVYALDFSLPAGRYVVSAAGARSPAFSVAAPASLYGPLLGNALFYYRSVRDGPDFVRGPLSPAPSHLNDQHATGYYNPPIQAGGNELLTTAGRPLVPYGTVIDASGGHWDAGDNMKYVETESYTAALMEVGVRDFPGQLGAAAPAVKSRAGTVAPDFTGETEFSLGFLMRMYDDARRLLYFQVGNTQSWKHFPKLRADYDFWRLPTADDTAPDSPPGDKGGDYSFIRRRPVFAAGPAGSTADPAGRPLSPNLAGRLAAAFALYAQLHPASADRALQAAKDVYAQADLSRPDPASGKRRLLTIIPYDGYPETVWDDDMELGATELYLATGDGAYLAQAAGFAARYDKLPAGDKDTLNLYDVAGLAHFELSRALAQAGDPAGPAVTRAGLLRALTRQLDGALKVARRDAFRFGRDWRAGDTTSHGDGLAVMADEVDALRHDLHYDRDARGWLGNMLGANPWGVSLIIGAGSRWTQCPQQQPANLLGSLTGGAPELWGAAVEGPTSAATSGGYDTMKHCPPRGGDTFARFNGNDGTFRAARRAVYRDNVESYSTTEPAIDLTATSLLAFAWRQQPLQVP
jgi:endoglucanase